MEIHIPSVSKQNGTATSNHTAITFAILAFDLYLYSIHLHYYYRSQVRVVTNKRYCRQKLNTQQSKYTLIPT